MKSDRGKGSTIKMQRQADVSERRSRLEWCYDAGVRWMRDEHDTEGGRAGELKRERKARRETEKLSVEWARIAAGAIKPQRRKEKKERGKRRSEAAA